jgi:transposase
LGENIMAKTRASLVGIDVAKSTLDLASEIRPGKYQTRSKVPNTPAGFTQIQTWLSKHASPDAWVVMEATSVYHEKVATFLLEHGYRVCVVNPAQIAAYAKSELSRTKTDKTDAKLIVRFGLSHLPRLRLWQPPTPAQRTLLALTRRLDDLKTLRQMEANRLDTADRAVRPSLQTVLNVLDEQIKATEEALKQHIDDDPDMRRQRDLLISIKGVKDLTAARLMAELGDVDQFNDVREVVAFAGLNPALRQSGTWKGHVRISKMGSSTLRAALYMPAISAMQHNPAVRALADRLRARAKQGRVIVVAAMRKLLHIAYGVLKSGREFDPEMGLTAGM